MPGNQLKNSRVEARTFFTRAWTLFGGAVVLAVILVVRLFQLQVLEYDEYKTRSEHNRIEVQPVAAGRGLIFINMVLGDFIFFVPITRTGFL